MECGAWQAGDREGRPYGGLQGVPCGRADRGVRPYGWGIDGAVCGGTHGSRPTTVFVGQGPCALPGVRYKVGGRTGASAPTDSLVAGEVDDPKGRFHAPPPFRSPIPPGFLTSLTMISAPHAADLDTLLIFNIF